MISYLSAFIAGASEGRQNRDKQMFPFEKTPNNRFLKSVDAKFAPYAYIRSEQPFSMLFQKRISYSTIRIVREYMFAEYRRNVEELCAANSYKQPTISCGPINIHNVDPQMRT